MSYDPHDTICAVASAAGSAARGIVRVSGTETIRIVDQLFECGDGEQLDRLRQATAVVGCVKLNPPLPPPYKGGDIELPCDVFVWPTSQSYTREPVVELHTIGSPPLIDALVSAICEAGARLAEPGEFTLRAFLAGRIDLTQAEAVLEVIDAHGDAELDVALAQLAGGLARPLQSLREELLQLLAELEAGLDFVEEDIQFVSQSEVCRRLTSARELLGNVAQQMASRSTAGVAAQVALVGRPNVGKSSLFNAMVERYGVRSVTGDLTSRTALVSPTRGTTRDYVTALVDLDGIKFELVDTAGIDDGSNADEKSGIDAAAQSLAADRRGAAKIRLSCVEGGNIPVENTKFDDNEIVVFTKSDLSGHERALSSIRESKNCSVITSSRTGTGVDQLSAAIRQAFTEGPSADTQTVGATADRCRESVRLAQAAIDRAANIAAESGGHELVAAEIRISLDELGTVVGAVYTDDLLDRIFSTFCIGK
jgi:tRNA modification GTPase